MLSFLFFLIYKGLIQITHELRNSETRWEMPAGSLMETCRMFHTHGEITHLLSNDTLRKPHSMYDKTDEEWLEIAFYRLDWIITTINTRRTTRPLADKAVFITSITGSDLIKTTHKRGFYSLINNPITPSRDDTQEQTQWTGERVNPLSPDQKENKTTDLLNLRWNNPERRSKDDRSLKVTWKVFNQDELKKHEAAAAVCISTSIWGWLDWRVGAL